MNIALPLLMKSGTRIPQDRLVRVNSLRAIGSGISLNFVEGTPLDSTHLLVAVVRWASSAAITVTGGGWTEAAGGGANGTNQHRVYARQGNGSVNGISLSGTSTNKTLFIMAFSGYSSDVALAGYGENGVSGSSHAIALPSPPSGYGVAIASWAIPSGVTSYDSASNGFTLTGANADGGVPTLRPARKEYLASGDGGTTLSVTGSGTPREQIVVFPLTP